MSFLDSIFGKKPTKKEIMAFNYYLFFDYIPKRLHDWANNKCPLLSALTFDSLVQKNSTWKSLIKKISITDSSLKKCSDITAYLIKAPSTEMMGEVAMAMLAVNSKNHKYEYFTMEYSLGNFAICSADEYGNHYNIDSCANGEVFGAFVVRSALEHLITASAPQSSPKSTSKPQSTTTTDKPSSQKPSSFVHTAESLLNTLEKIADQYYKERGVVSLDDWMVTKKIGNDFKFYITQYPDAEFEDPNCEVTLMVDFMDHNGRMGIVNKFFGKKESSPEPLKPAPKPSNGKYFTIEQLRQIPMGELRLQPIDAGIVFDQQQQEIVRLFAEKSPRIKKYLPNLDLSSNEAIAKYFMAYCMKTEAGLEFGYSIKMVKLGDVGYMGFIFVHTPALNEVAINFPHWTVDFCIFEPLEGRAFMRGSLRHVLRMLKEQLNVPDVFAIVDEDNERCLQLMKKLPFELRPEFLTDPTTGNHAKLFRCDLKDFNF